MGLIVIITLLLMVFCVSLMGWEAHRFLREQQRDEERWMEPTHRYGEPIDREHWDA